MLKKTCAGKIANVSTRLNGCASAAKYQTSSVYVSYKICTKYNNSSKMCSEIFEILSASCLIFLSYFVVVVVVADVVVVVVVVVVGFIDAG